GKVFVRLCSPRRNSGSSTDLQPMNPHYFTPLTRRDMLRRCACGFGYLALTSLLAETARAAAGAANNPLAPRPAHFPPRARRIIFLFMPGGPSQVDTFDPKPRLERDRDKAFPMPAPEGVTMAPGRLLPSPWEFKKHGD